MADVHEVADGVFRISTYMPEFELSMNQFLFRDEEPLLFHTGGRALFADTCEAIGRVLDPATLRWISWSHLESDECGAANDFLRLAPGAEPVTGEMGLFLDVGDFFERPVRGMADGDILEIGRHRLRFLVTPHVPHSWDACLVFDETARVLLASDLFTQSGVREPVAAGDVVERTLEAHRRYPDYLPVGPHTERTLTRLAALAPTAIAAMHGPVCTGDPPGALRDLSHGLFTNAAAG